jgi:flagellar FliL protein
MSKSKSESDGKDEPKKKSKKMLLILIVAALAAAGGGAYFMLKPSGPPAPPDPGVVVKLDPITVNLTDGHYLKIGVALQAIKSPSEAAIDGSKALDLTVDQFSNLSVAQLSNKGRDKEKAALTKKVVKAYDGDIMGVYLTEFVMQ